MKKIYDFNNKSFNALMQKEKLFAINGVVIPHHIVTYMIGKMPLYAGDMHGTCCGAAAAAHYIWQFTKEKFEFKKELFDALITTSCVEENDDGSEGMILDSGIHDLLPPSGYVVFPEKYHGYDGMYFHYSHQIDTSEIKPSNFDDVKKYLLKQDKRQIHITLDGPDAPAIVLDVNAGMAGFSYYNKPDSTKFIKEVLVPLINVLQYLIIDEADVVGNKWVKVNNYTPPKGPIGVVSPRKKANTIVVGKTIAKKLNEASSETVDSTGRRVKPHLRKAHWHRFRCGPGRKETKLKWLYTILVGA